MMPEGLRREGWGSIHLRRVHGACSRRDSAPYSLLSLYWTTSNWRGPTAARSVEPGGADLAEKDCTTPSCSSCSRPALNFFESEGFGLEMNAKTSGGKRGISSKRMERSAASV